jgi:uncharacterized OB-fold protein
MQCEHCGATIAEEARFCLTCGQPKQAALPISRELRPGAESVTVEQVCPSCGHRNFGQRLDCESCGAVLITPTVIE